MAIQILRALSSATTVVAVDTSMDKLETAKRMGTDDALISGDEAVTRIKDMTRGQGAELVIDMVGINPTRASRPRLPPTQAVRQSQRIRGANRDTRVPGRRLCRCCPSPLPIAAGYAGSSLVNRTGCPMCTASTCGSKMKWRWFSVMGVVAAAPLRESCRNTAAYCRPPLLSR